MMLFTSTVRAHSRKALRKLLGRRPISPILTLHPAFCKLHTKAVDDNLRLKTQYPYEEDKKNENKKPLAVIISWLSAKDAHLEKYCNLYLVRGFDVLTVDIAPKDLLFPVTGSQVVAKNLLDYLSDNSQYERIVFHTFSVGAYLMGEIFIKMQENASKYMPISNRMAGIICDSAVDWEGTKYGVPRSLSKNPLTVKVLEWYVSAHMTVMYNIATKHYIKASQFFHNTPLRCPAMFFGSEADKIATVESNIKAVNCWTAKGIDVHMKCFKDTVHVSHMMKHRDEYVSEVDRFLAKLNLSSSK